MDREKMESKIAQIRLSEIFREQAEVLVALAFVFEKDLPATAKINLKQALEELKKAVKKIEEVLQS